MMTEIINTESTGKKVWIRPWTEPVARPRRVVDHYLVGMGPT